MQVTVTAQSYIQDGVTFDAALVTCVREPRPGVLVIHGWEGRSASQERFAARLAELGFAAFCVDLYGNGKHGTTPEICRALMDPLLSDRALLRRRLVGAVEAAGRLPSVDAESMAAIGFCFGGLCALDLARANAPLKGVVSFHGVLKAPPGPAPESIHVPVLILHGWDDPMAKPADVLALADELTASKADWQFHAFGGTMHAFMAQGSTCRTSGSYTAKGLLVERGPRWRRSWRNGLRIRDLDQAPRKHQASAFVE